MGHDTGVGMMFFQTLILESVGANQITVTVLQKNALMKTYDHTSVT